MNYEEYIKLCNDRGIPCPIDKEKEELLKYCTSNIMLYQDKTSDHEMKIYAEIINHLKDVDLDTKILTHSRLGYSGYALAYVGFEELETDYLLLEAKEKLQSSKLATIEIRNSVLTAVLDKNAIHDKETLKAIFHNNHVKVFTEDVYIHPFFNKNETPSGTEKTKNATASGLYPEADILPTP